MPFVARCHRAATLFVAEGSLPLQTRRSKTRKTHSNSGCLSCLWVGFPPAPRFQLQRPTALTASTTSYHFVPHLSAKSFIVKQKLDGTQPPWTPIWETTKAFG